MRGNQARSPQVPTPSTRARVPPLARGASPASATRSASRASPPRLGIDGAACRKTPSSGSRPSATKAGSPSTRSGVGGTRSLERASSIESNGSSNGTDVALDSLASSARSALSLHTQASYTARSSLDTNPERSGSSPPPATAPMLGLLQAAPLVHGGQPVEMLDLKSERDAIISSVQRAGCSVRVACDFCTTKRLRSLLTDGCRLLHYSGHGFSYVDRAGVQRARLAFEDGLGGRTGPDRTRHPVATRRADDEPRRPLTRGLRDTPRALRASQGRTRSR